MVVQELQVVYVSVQVCLFSDLAQDLVLSNMVLSSLQGDQCCS